MNLTDIFTNDSEKPVPKPNAVRRLSGDESPWNPEHVRGIICNPCYAGVGPYPGLVPEAAWVHAAARTIQEDGAEQFLVNMLHPPGSCVRLRVPMLLRERARDKVRPQRSMDCR